MFAVDENRYLNENSAVFLFVKIVYLMKRLFFRRESQPQLVAAFFGWNLLKTSLHINSKNPIVTEWGQLDAIKNEIQFTTKQRIEKSRHI